MDQIIKNIPKYTINELGIVKNLNGKIIKTSRRRGKNRKYYCVKLRHEKRSTTYSIHRLLAETFILNPYNHPEVNHKDGNPLNNNLDNLEWVTQEENKNHYLNLKKYKKEILIHQIENLLDSPNKEEIMKLIRKL